jgi:integrase
MTAPRGPHSGPHKLRSFKLTERFVRRLVEEIVPTRETVYADLDVPRFYLRTRPASQPGRPWSVEARVRYTAPGGRRVWLNVGNPRTMPLPALRAAARAALAIVDGGGDPASDRARAAAIWTVRQMWEAYRGSPELARCAPEVRRALARRFEVHILPRLGNERLSAIDVPMARRLLRAITADNRTNASKRRLGGPGAARKTVRLLSAALTWAVVEGQLERNPLRGALRLDGDGVRETVITQPADYVALFAAMDAMVAAGTLRAAVRAFFVVAALTGMRRGELQALTWPQVNLTERRITLATSKGAKLARRGVKQESVSLPPLAAAVLAGIQPTEATGADRVFPPRTGHRVYVNADWHRVRTAAGLPADLTLHGLRHSLGTSAVLAGLTGPEAQQLLRHRSAAVTNRYLHLAELATQRLADRATAHLTADIAPPPSAEILPLPRRRG